MSYWGTPNKQRGPLSGVLENGDVVPLKQLSHLTYDFSVQEIEFIQDNKENPFFMYLANNAPCTLQDDFIIPCPKFGTN